MATKKKKAATKERVDPYPTPEHPPEETLPGEVLDPDGGFPEEHKMSFTISLKEAILLHLWGYSGQAKDEETKAQIIESHDILKEGIVAVKLMELDRKKGTYKLRTSRKKKFSEEHINNHLDKPWTRLALADLYGFRKELLETLKEDPLRSKHFKVGRHGIRQLTGRTGPQIAMTFEEGPVELDEYISQAGLQLTGKDLERMERWGADLTVTQHSVLLAILEKFSDTDYQGQGKVERKEVLTRSGVQSMGSLLRKAVKNIDSYPYVRVTLSEVVELAGLDKNRQGDKMEAKEALEHLNGAHYAFYYERLAWTETKGRKSWVLNQDRKPVKEAVRSSGPILHVKEITDPESGQLDYYEISPSLPFLEQVTDSYGSRAGYFLMIPTGLQEEVRKAMGQGRRVTAQHYAFLYWLLGKYEDRRAKAKEKEPNLIVKGSYEDIAQRIRLPETVWRRNKKTALKRMDKIYQAAKDLGYLKSYSMGTDGIVTLELNPEGPYYRPKKERKSLEEATLRTVSVALPDG